MLKIYQLIFFKLVLTVNFSCSALNSVDEYIIQLRNKIAEK